MIYVFFLALLAWAQPVGAAEPVKDCWYETPNADGTLSKGYQAPCPKPTVPKDCLAQMQAAIDEMLGPPHWPPKGEENWKRWAVVITREQWQQWTAAKQACWKEGPP